MLSFEEREGGASMVIMDIRYMWSDIDSPLPDVRFALFSRVMNSLADPKSTPSFTLGRLQTLEHVEEGDWRS